MFSNRKINIIAVLILFISVTIFAFYKYNCHEISGTSDLSRKASLTENTNLEVKSREDVIVPEEENLSDIINRITIDTKTDTTIKGCLRSYVAEQHSTTALNSAYDLTVSCIAN